MEKFVFLGLVVITYFALITQARDFKTFCRGKRLGNHQHPTNCRQYVVCWRKGAVYVRSCQGNLYYNNVYNRCDWPQNVKCNVKAVAQNVCGDSRAYHAYCPVWKNNHFCQLRSHRASMLVYCKKTCGWCKTPVNGGYSMWASWSSCSASCGPGTRERKRSCNNPAPRNGGARCVGASKQPKTCFMRSCSAPINGGYSEWTSWSTCRSPNTCGKGTQERKRQCDNPVPQNGGAACVGSTKESQSCNIICPSSGCADNPDHAENCIGWAEYCPKGNEYYAFMQLNCKDTCGFCGKVTPLPTVSDSNTCGVDKPGVRGRVVGGFDAYPNRWVWQGALYYYDDFTCGGSLIDEDLFVTAAHCVMRRDEGGMVIRMGDHKREQDDGTEQERRVIQVIPHADWDLYTIQNDIAIIKVEKKFKLNKNVGKICLPEKDDAAPDGNATCYITGWGRTNVTKYEGANILQEALLPVVDNADCVVRNANSEGFSKVTSSMICGGNKATDKVSGCKGDSGGPYVCKKGKKWVLQGVVSWGSGRCDASHRFTVFTRVSSYLGWIKDTRKEMAKV